MAIAYSVYAYTGRVKALEVGERVTIRNTKHDFRIGEECQFFSGDGKRISLGFGRCVERCEDNPVYQNTQPYSDPRARGGVKLPKTNVGKHHFVFEVIE